MSESRTYLLQGGEAVLVVCGGKTEEVTSHPFLYGARAEHAAYRLRDWADRIEAAARRLGGPPSKPPSPPDPPLGHAGTARAAQAAIDAMEGYGGVHAGKGKVA